MLGCISSKLLCEDVSEGAAVEAAKWTAKQDRGGLLYISEPLCFFYGIYWYS